MGESACQGKAVLEASRKIASPFSTSHASPMRSFQGLLLAQR
jgi:hypothetical protein